MLRHTLLTTIDARTKTSYRTVHHKPHPPYNWLTREQRLHIALYCDKVLNARHTLPTTDWRQNKDFIKQCIAIKYWMLDTPSLQLIDARTKTSYRTVHHKPHPPYNWLTPEQRLHIALYCDKVLNARPTLLKTDWRQNKDFIQNCTPQATPFLQQFDPEQRLHIALYCDKVLNARHTLFTTIDARTKTSYRTVHHKPHPPYNWLTPEQRLHIALYCDKVLNARHTLLTTIDARTKTSYRTVHHKPHPSYNWLTPEQRLHIAQYWDKILNARHTLPTTDWRQNKDFIKQCIVIKYWMLDTPSLQLIYIGTKTSYRTVHHKPHPSYNWLMPEQRLHIAQYWDKYWMLDTPSLQLIDVRTKTSYSTVLGWTIEC